MKISHDKSPDREKLTSELAPFVERALVLLLIAVIVALLSLVGFPLPGLAELL